MRYLTVFPGLNKSHLYKDVGSIPFFLNEGFHWQCTILCCPKTPAHLIRMRDASFESRVKILPAGYASNKLLAFFRVTKFLLWNSRWFDAVTLYHDSLEAVIYAILYRLLN